MAGLLALVGCFEDRGLNLGTIDRTQDLFPDKFEMPVTLRLANVTIEAEAILVTDGTTRTIKISRDGVPIEDEVYVVTRESVSIKSLSTSEAFDPPLTLLKMPLTIGDTYEWEGKIDFAGPALASTAKVVTSKDTPDLPT